MFLLHKGQRKICIPPDSHLPIAKEKAYLRSFLLFIWVTEQRYSSLQVAPESERQLGSPRRRSWRAPALAEHTGKCSSRTPRAQAHFLACGVVGVWIVGGCSFLLGAGETFFPWRLHPGGSWGRASAQDSSRSWGLGRGPPGAWRARSRSLGAGAEERRRTGRSGFPSEFSAKRSPGLRIGFKRV